MQNLKKVGLKSFIDHTARVSLKNAERKISLDSVVLVTDKHCLILRVRSLVTHYPDHEHL